MTLKQTLEDLISKGVRPTDLYVNIQSADGSWVVRHWWPKVIYKFVCNNQEQVVVVRSLDDGILWYDWHPIEENIHDVKSLVPELTLHLTIQRSLLKRFFYRTYLHSLLKQYSWAELYD